MAVERFSITMDPDLGVAVRDAAADAGMSVSSWIARAVEDKVRHQRLGAALDAWEAEDGPLTDDELKRSAELLDGDGDRSSPGSAA